MLTEISNASYSLAMNDWFIFVWLLWKPCSSLNHSWKHSWDQSVSNNEENVSCSKKQQRAADKIRTHNWVVIHRLQVRFTTSYHLETPLSPHIMFLLVYHQPLSTVSENYCFSSSVQNLIISHVQMLWVIIKKLPRLDFFPDKCIFTLYMFSVIK